MLIKRILSPLRYDFAPYQANQIGHVYNGPQKTSTGEKCSQALMPTAYSAYKAYQGLDKKRWQDTLFAFLLPKEFTAWQMTKKQNNKPGFWNKVGVAFLPQYYSTIYAEKFNRAQKPNRIQ